LLLFLWLVPQRLRCLEYLCALIIFPHFGHVGTGYYLPDSNSACITSRST